MPVLAAEGYRVVAPDLRGFGDSDTPEGTAQYTLRRSCADLAALLDHFHVPFAIVIGHDWCVCMCVYVCVCMCVFVCESEREANTCAYMP
jgi:hypothetical protein